MVKVSKFLKNAKSTYSQSDTLYDSLLENKHHVPLQTLLSNDIDSERLLNALKNLNSYIEEFSLENPSLSGSLMDTIKTLDLATLERLEKMGQDREHKGDRERSGIENDLIEELKKLEKQTEMQTDIIKNLSSNQKVIHDNITVEQQGSPNPQPPSQEENQESNTATTTQNVVSGGVSQPFNFQPGTQGTSSTSSEDASQSNPKNTSSTSMQAPGFAPPAAPAPQLNIVSESGKPIDSSAPGPINIVAQGVVEADKLDENAKKLGLDEETQRMKLAKIPDNILKTTSTDWEPVNYQNVDISYDLYELSKVEIKYDDEHQKILYKIIEPELTEEDQKNLDELKKGFIYVFEKFSPEFVNISGKDLIVQGTKKLCGKYNIKLTSEEFERITYYLIRDFLGLELLEPIMHDPYIEDVSCDGLNTAIFVNHLKYGALEVNRKYTDTDKLNSFIVKLAQRSNQEVSLSKPILQGALPDGSRVEAIYGKEVSEKGSSFTIRKFREEPFTPIHLIDLGTLPAFVLAYLWLAIENKQSVLVSGGTATGKTTILNALSLFAPPSSKIVSIEDTPEINLPHEHWLSLISRESEGKAEVSMFDLLKASLRERPDYIIVGEIRGQEASILFQGMATGHAGLGTVHAEKFDDLVNRMTIPPINLPKQLLTELKIIIFMKQMKVKDNMVRRASSIVEVVGYNPKNDVYYTNEFVRYTPSKDEFGIKEKSAVISALLDFRGGEEESLWREIEKRRRILDFMHQRKILEFKEVSEILQMYYKDPANIFPYLESYAASHKQDNGEEQK